MEAERKPRIILGLITIGPEGSPEARMASLDDFKKSLNIFQGPGALIDAFDIRLKSPGMDSVDVPVDKLYKAGKSLRFGLSNDASFEVAAIVMTCVHNGWIRPTAYQAIYNYLFRTIEDELIQTCRRYGIAVDVHNPTGGRFLLGRTTSKNNDPKEGKYTTGPFQHLTRGRYSKYSTIAGAQMIPMRWLAHHSELRVREGHDGIVIGFSNIQRLKDNLDYIEKGLLDMELLQVLDRVWKMSRGDMETYWQLPMAYTYDTKEEPFRRDFAT
ncbi:Aldo/keto reductase [Daldinia sp. FL1419]|nr:Aldo/keto reductase [Daldinia sp. FL1419]